MIWEIYITTKNNIEEILKKLKFLEIGKGSENYKYYANKSLPVFVQLEIDKLELKNKKLNACYNADIFCEIDFKHHTLILALIFQMFRELEDYEIIFENFW